MNVIDVTAKVCQYLDEMVVGSVGSSNKTASLQRLRGPGQPSMDPLQFVVPPSNVMDMAEKAKQLVNLTEQQKKMRGMEMDKNKQPNTVFEEEWQSDLDTWRRKRKNRLSAEADVKPSDIIQPKVEVKKCEESSAEINSSNSGFHRDIQRYTSKKTELHGIYTDDDSEDYSNEYHKNLKEEILTIRSPTAEDNNDSGIENNRNSSSHSPSTSLDFSPRSTDFLSPKSHTSSTENLPPPPPPPPSLPPFEASSPQPTRHLDQVLVPIPTVGATALHRPSPLEETVDYPPPPHHLRQTSVDRKLHNHTETDILTPNKARISATIPSSSYLREHTKVEPFVAQSIREHQIVTSKLPETNVDLTVELNREQKAIVSANKFPNREPSSASKRSETAANSAFPSDSLNSQYRFGSTEDYSQQERNNRTKSYYQYRNSQQNDNSTSRSTPTIQASRNLSHSVSTPTVSGNTMTAPSPSATTTLYRTVDIHFDDTSSTSTYQPPKRDKDGLIAITVELGAQPVHKGFGFSINCEKRQCLVDAVVVGTPADKQGLQIGDRIDSINGEKTADQFPSAINRAIHEATRMGEIHLRIERKDVRTFTSTSNNLTNKCNDVSSPSKFKQTRSMFNTEKQVESYSEFKRKHSRTPRDYPAARDYNSLPRSTSTSVNSYESLPRRREQSMQSSYGNANVREPFGGSSRSLTSSDYRVTSLHDKVGPGKLSDFVPEVERARAEDGPRRRFVDSEETPRTIRNYQVSSSELGYRSLVQQTQHQNSGSSYKPAEINYIDEQQHNNQIHVKPSSSTEVHVPISILKTSSLTGQIRHENQQKQEQQLRSQEHHYATLEHIRKALREPVSRTIPIEILRPVGEVPLTPVTHTSEYDIISDGDESDDLLFQRMHQKQPFHTVRSYGISREAQMAPRSRSAMTSYASVPELRSKSTESLDISNVSHRFYDRDGNHVHRDQTIAGSMPIKIRREYGEYKYRSEEKTILESRDWRDVINQQRQAAPGNAADNQKIREVTASMSNLPSIIDRKHEESKKLIRDQNDFQYQNRDWKQSQPEIQTSRTEAFTSYNSLGYKPKPTNNFNNTASYKSNTLREEVSRYDDYQSKTIVNSSSTIQNPQKEAKEYTPSGYAEEKQDNVVAVSGKHRCAHCSTELGRGAAMIVESLNLYYHLACFKCFVCKTPLGSGATGTDVRVREGRLHCQSCYSNDKLQLSKV